MFNNIFVGSVEGTGAAINVETGFKPRYVKVLNIDDAGSLNPTIEWFEGMTAAYGLKNLRQAVDEGGTATYSVVNEIITSLGISQYAGAAGSNSEGFTIGADTDLNVSGETIVYIALR